MSTSPVTSVFWVGVSVNTKVIPAVAVRFESIVPPVPA